MTERDDKAGALQRTTDRTVVLCVLNLFRRLYTLYTLYTLSALSLFLAISLSRYLGSVTKTENHLTIRAERI